MLPFFEGIVYRSMLPSLLILALLSPFTSASASTCYGTAAAGRLDGGMRLPANGDNFVPYTSLGITLGRTYVHQHVHDVIVDAYSAVHQTMPDKRFMYGETGLAGGGAFKPHRTHQAGISVDFMVPVVDRDGKSVLLPSSALNKFGYGLEFDQHGMLDGLTIDFEAMAEHLYQLAQASKKHGITIQRVIFDQPLMAALLKTRRGGYLRSSVTFMKTKPWIRHDEHYHVDFSLPCRPLGEYGKRKAE